MKLILSVSGGGIRGIIPAMILDEMERRARRPIASCFQLIAGTSTGGIIAALLSTPNEQGAPQYSGTQVVELYKLLGQKIFKQSIFRKVATFDGILGVKYNTQPLETLLKSYFGQVRLSQTVTDLLIPAYQISGKPYPYFFKTHKAGKGHSRLENPYLWECARATSAANGDRYFRLQASLDEDSLKMDDVSEDNLARLEYAARQTIEKNNGVINEIAALML